MIVLKVNNAMGNVLNSDSKNAKNTVLKNSLAGGPLGLGDPDDRSLRVVEKDILVSKIVREKVRRDKCVVPADALEKCGVEAKLLLPFKCTHERDELLRCSEYWFNNEDFRKECTEEYLNQRSYYRRTGQRGYLYKEGNSVQ